MNNSVDRGGGNGLMRDALGALGLYYLADNILSCLVAAIVAPVFLLCFGGFIFYQLRADQKEDELRATAKTEEVLTSASDLIQRESRTLGRLLYEDEGNQRLRHSHDDGWRNPVTYEVVDTTTYVIRSNGKDSRRNTSDDMTLQRKLAMPSEPKDTDDDADNR